MTLKYTQDKELESNFIEIINKDKKNYMVGCIYKHPRMLTHQFNDMLTPILEKISLKNKGYVMGDFNITFMDYETETFFLISSMALGLLDLQQIFSQLYLIELLGLLTDLGLLELWHLIHPRFLTGFGRLV